MGMSVFAEVVSLPVFYVDTAIPEDAGDGNVRVTNCVTRNGVLIPKFEVIIHSTRLVLAARVVADCANMVFNRQLLAIGMRH